MSRTSGNFFKDALRLINWIFKDRKNKKQGKIAKWINKQMKR